MPKSRSNLLIFLLSILLSSFSPQKGRRPTYKLLLYATLNDSLEVDCPDTSWLHSKVCLQLKIDTVNTSSGLELKASENKFYYKKHLFGELQLFNLNQYDSLKNLYIASFDVTLPGRVEPPSVTTGSNCMSDEQKSYILTYYKTFKARHSPQDKFKIYFDRILLSNSYASKNDEGLNEILNAVVCYIEL